MLFKRIAAILLLMAVSGCSTAKTEPLPEAVTVTTEAKTEENVKSASEMLECRHYSESIFQLSDRRGSPYKTEGEILCGVVPHHLTAGYFISGFLKATAESRSNIETVVIVAPLHYESMNDFSTTDKDWVTPFGVLETDRELTSLFKEKLGAVSDDEMLQHDHSAASHIPFVKYYLPEVKTACLLIAPQKNGGISEEIAELLSEMAEMKSCLFLFSIDFSHYLSPEEADYYDEITLDAVLSGDTEEIEAMTNNNVDSPVCLSTYVRLSELLGGRITAADNSNTWEITELPYNKETFPEGVTSYFSFITT